MADVNITFGADDLKKVTAEIQKAVKSLNDVLKKFGTVTKADVESSKKLAKSAKLVAAEKKKLNSVDRERIKISKQLTTVNAKLALANSKEARTLAAKKKQLQDVNRLLRTGTKNTATWGKALGSFQFKFNALGNIAASATSAISRAVAQGIRGAIRTLTEFDQAMADVKSITGATGKEFDDLSNSAKRLGGITKFTAVQVAQLQKEYSKLGFTTKEILKAQAATLDLAAATGTDLARAAEVVGVTIRQFGLDASEAQRITDVMARSFTSSALDMEKFAEAMKFVGPAAKASGISIEETTALIGQLADAGISGSMAGTSLRQIMLALSGESGTLAEKFQRAAEKGLSLAGASDLVQRRAATALIVLADGVDTLDDFTEALENAGGAAREMAEVQLDTVAGKATIVKSAWDGMTLAMLSTKENADGIKGALGGITRFLNALQTQFETGIDIKNALLIERVVHKSIKDMEEELSKVPLTLEQIKSGAKGMLDVFKQFGREIIDDLFPKEKTVINTQPAILQLKNLDEEWAKMFTGIAENMDLTEQENREFLDAFSSEMEEFRRKEEALNKDTFDKIEEQNEAELDLEKKKNKAILAEAELAEAKKQAIIQGGFNFASGLVSALSRSTIQQRDAELAKFEDNEEMQNEIRLKFAKKEQDIAVATALINGAIGITNIWATWAAFPPVAIALSVLEAALVGVQVGVIKNQKFAEGGPINGESHSRGGVNLEAEGGEYIINKRSTGKYRDLIEAINQDDQVRIMDAMSRDKKIIIKQSDPYTQKMYELMSEQVQYGEDNEFYYKHKGNMLIKVKKR